MKKPIHLIFLKNPKSGSVLPSYFGADHLDRSKECCPLTEEKFWGCRTDYSILGLVLLIINCIYSAFQVSFAIGKVYEPNVSWMRVLFPSLVESLFHGVFFMGLFCYTLYRLDSSESDTNDTDDNRREIHLAARIQYILGGVCLSSCGVLITTILFLDQWITHLPTIVIFYSIIPAITSLIYIVCLGSCKDKCTL